MRDYLIIGTGLAGIAFCETALQNNKSFWVINDHSENSTKIAAGLYNPVILKRFSQVWHAAEQLNILNTFYYTLENKLNIKLDYKLPIYRKLYSIEEQNNWYQATDKPNVGAFLSADLIQPKYPYVDNPFKFGMVLKTGYIDTARLQSEYIKYLQSMDCYCNERFIHNDLMIYENYVQYKNRTARHIIFAEGYGIRHNPFFNYLPADGTKGEIIVIRAPDLKVAEIINSAIYLVPLGDDLYKIGATYNWDDKTDHPTAHGKDELLQNVKNLITCDFEVIAHYAGIRPTVKDRRPLVGTHPRHNKCHVLNGLGTRGVMLAPEMAQYLYQYIENKIPLDQHIDITRYADKQHLSNLD